MTADRVSAVFWLAFGILTMFLSRKLGLGSLKRIEPGFFPFWSGVLICFFSMIIMLQRKIAPNEEKPERIDELWTGTSWVKALTVALVTLFYVLTFTHIGFLISTFILILILLRAIDPVKWWKALLAAFLASFVSFAFFDLWLQAQLPHWILEGVLYQWYRLLFYGR